MKNAIAIAGEFENPKDMIAAIKAYRARQAAREALRERIEEQAANEAIKKDPEVKKWVWAAALENTANN